MGEKKEAIQKDNMKNAWQGQKTNRKVYKIFALM